MLVLDFSLLRCAWRAASRGRERLGFWRWVAGYRRRPLPRVMAAIDRHAPGAQVLVFRGPRALRRFVARVAATVGPAQVGPAQRSPSTSARSKVTGCSSCS